MRVKPKWLFYIDNIRALASANPIRMVLTAAGIFVSVFLFAAGYILITSYYGGMLRFAQQRASRSIVCESYFTDSDGRLDIKEQTGKELTQVMDLTSSRCLLSVPLEDEEHWFNLTAKVHGMGRADELLPVTDDLGRFIPIEPELTCGRFFTEQEAASGAPLIIIDRYTADLIFEDEDPIGKTVTLNAGINGGTAGVIGGGSLAVNMTVVGVVEPSLIQESRLLQVKKQIIPQNSDVKLEADVWIPLMALPLFPDYYPDSIRWMGLCETDEEYEQVLSGARKVAENYELIAKPFSVESREDYISVIKTEHSYTRRILNFAVLVLCIISGISIMSITVFSVKERIPEIGIRKAFGATGLDVAFQTVLEIVLLAAVVSVVAVCLAYYACKAAELYATRKLLMDFSIRIPTYKLLLPVFVGMLEAFICSILPAVYAANISVTKALRFE